MPSRSQITAYAVRMAAHYNVPASIVLAVIFHESRFQTDVTSTVGAIGLMQLMPATAHDLGVNAHDWRQNVEGGTHLLSELKGSEGTWKNAIAAYGWGVGNADDPHAQAAAADVIAISKRYDSMDTAAAVHKLPIDSAALAIQIARAQSGDQYVWGAEGPNKFDCSGLMYFAFKQAGVNIPRLTAAGYQQLTQNVSRADLQPGDLVFFNFGRLGAGTADHVGLYIGGGKMIDTRDPQNPVQIEDVMWGNFIGGGRVPGLDYSTTKQVHQALRGAVGAPIPAGFGGSHVSAQELRATLVGLGLNPNAFGDLIHQSVVQQWSQAELAAAIYSSDEFHRMFPGIFNPDGSLKMSPKEWTQIAFGEGGYSDIARNAGVKIGRDGIGTLIEGNVSPDEWAFRARVLHLAQSSDSYRQTFNATLKAAGQKPLEKGDWFNFVAGRTDPRIENMYEAVALQQTKGLDISPLQALKASGQIGQPGEQVDLKQLVANVRQVKSFIAPELANAGISDADLAVLESGSDPKNIKGTLDKLINSRQALVGQRATATSTKTLFPATPVGA